MIMELSLQTEHDAIAAACIETKQWHVEEESIAEALAWSYEHGDIQKVTYVDRLAKSHHGLSRYEDSKYGRVADESDLPRGFSNFDDSHEALKLGKQANVRHGVLSKKWKKQSDSRAIEDGSSKGGLVSKVHSTKSRMNRMFRDWTPILGPQLGNAGSVISELFGRSAEFSVDLAEFEYTGTTHMGDAHWEDMIDREETVEAPVVRLQKMDFAHQSDMTGMNDVEYTEETVTVTEVHSRSRHYENSVHSGSRQYKETVHSPRRQVDDTVTYSF